MIEATDKRRFVSRIMTFEVMDMLSGLARRTGDMIGLLAFTAIWTINTAHLRSATDRYAALRDIPPDSQRRPVSDEDLAAYLAIPRQILDEAVERLIAGGLVERREAGLVAPSAVFTRPEMLSGTNENYARLLALLSQLRAAGVSMGEAESNGDTPIANNDT